MRSNVETGDTFETAMDDRRWTMGTGTLSKSFELESWSYVQHKDYQLHILQKVSYFWSPSVVCDFIRVHRV